MVLESLAQYSALMVMKQKYSEEKIQQFLKNETETYFTGRAKEDRRELPLAIVEKQEYIYYRKGAVNMYALQDYIGEANVNLALKRFIKDWNPFDESFNKGRYATSKDLLGYFKDVTPDSLQYVIKDLFETLTHFENKTTQAKYEKLSENQYKVSLTLEAIKCRTDSLGVDKPIAVDDWIDVGIYSEGTEGKENLIYLQKHKITDQVTKLEIIIDQKPSKAGIDPLNKLIDKEASDNVKTVSVNVSEDD
jgi:aminopeptidase N